MRLLFSFLGPKDSFRAQAALVFRSSPAILVRNRRARWSLKPLPAWIFCDLLRVNNLQPKSSRPTSSIPKPNILKTREISPGGPLVKMPCSQCKGPGSIPGQETKIPHAPTTKLLSHNWRSPHNTVKTQHNQK